MVRLSLPVLYSAYCMKTLCKCKLHSRFVSYHLIWVVHFTSNHQDIPDLPSSQLRNNLPTHLSNRKKITPWENQAKSASTLPHPALLAWCPVPPLLPAQPKTLRKEWKNVWMKTEMTSVKPLLKAMSSSEAGLLQYFVGAFGYSLLTDVE